VIVALPPTEWKRRYATALAAGSGMSQELAQKAADDAFALSDEYLTPEDAAAEELSYWSAA